jgi:hypothetical protein
MAKRDFLKGDYSFKNWFRIAWKNKYIQICVLALAAMIYQVWNLGDMIALLEDNFAYSAGGGIMATIGLLIPSAIFIITAYKGLYQHWNHLKDLTK